jgi:hypothetical protein
MHYISATLRGLVSAAVRGVPLVPSETGPPVVVSTEKEAPAG